MKPDAKQPPPTKNECANIKTTLLRIERFYGEGAGNQGSFIEQARQDKREFEVQRARVLAQLEDLKKFPEELTYRQHVESDLNRESKALGIKIAAMERAGLTLCDAL